MSPVRDWLILIFKPVHLQENYGLDYGLRLDSNTISAVISLLALVLLITGGVKLIKGSDHGILISSLGWVFIVGLFIWFAVSFDLPF